MSARTEPARSRVEVRGVPTDGRCVAVRFLGPAIGVFTHRQRDTQARRDISVPCRGAKCENRLHNGKKIWKGYAPAQTFLSADGRWYLCAFEITESAWEVLGDRDYRGEVWILRRPFHATGNMEVDGFLDSRVDPELLEPPFDVRQVTQRLWRMPDVVYGVKPDLLTRLTAAPAEGAPPLCLIPEEEQATDPVPPPNKKAAKELWEEFKANGYRAGK